MDEAITAILNSETHEDLNSAKLVEAQDHDANPSEPSLDLNENYCSYPLHQDMSTGSSSSGYSSIILDSPSSPPSNKRKRQNNCSCSNLETTSKRGANTGVSLDIDLSDDDSTPEQSSQNENLDKELISPPHCPVNSKDNNPKELQTCITDDEDDIPSLKPKKYAIINSDEESEEDTPKDAEDSEEILVEEAVANISEAHTENAETNSQPERVKPNSSSSSSTMKEEIEFWSSYIGK